MSLGVGFFGKLIFCRIKEIWCLWICPVHIGALNKYIPTCQNASEYWEYQIRAPGSPVQASGKRCMLFEQMKSHKAGLFSEGQPCLFFTSRCQMEIRRPSWQCIVPFPGDNKPVPSSRWSWRLSAMILIIYGHITFHIGVPDRISEAAFSLGSSLTGHISLLSDMNNDW